MTDNYARNILLLDPFEVVVLHWPPGVESAIHHHEGFWGYVLCVEGEVENVEYTYDAERRELREGTAWFAQGRIARTGWHHPQNRQPKPRQVTRDRAFLRTRAR